MPDITTQIKTAIGAEPPLGFEPADVIASARRVRRRRRGGYAAATAGVAAAAVAGTVLALPGAAPGGASGGHNTGLSLTALTRIAGKQPPSAIKLSTVILNTTRVDGVTAPEVLSLFTKDTGAGLASAQASLLGKPAELDVTAGLATAGHPYLNIQVTPAKTLSTSMPTCAALSDLSSGSGDGYYGPCTIRRLADGSILVVRSGETRTGHFTMAQASLIRPDGSGVFAEDTNQSLPAADKGASKLYLPQVVRVDPPVDANTLARFVRDVAAMA
jgi:hypothetical protein